MSDLINFEMELNQNHYEATNTPQTVYGLIRIKPEEQSIKGKIPIDLSFLLDRSYSMGDRVDGVKGNNKALLDILLTQITSKKKNFLTKLDILKIAVNQLVDEMDINDKISIIAFDSNSKEVITREIKKDRDKKTIKQKINSISCGSSTNLSKSLKKVLNSSTPDGDRLKRVIIFTDGEVNTPSARQEECDCIVLARKAKKEKLPFTIFATGTTYNDKFLAELAEITGGRREHISDPSGAIDIFKEEMGVLGDIAITNMEANLTAEKNTIFREVSKVIPHITPLNISGPEYVFMSLGDLDRARGQAILFQAEIPPLPEGKHRVATLEVIFDVPTQKLIGRKCKFELEINCVNDKSICKANKNVLSTVQLAGANKLQTLAMTRADSGDTVSAAKMMNQVQNIYTKLGQNELAGQAKTLTNAINKGSFSATTKDLRRSLTTKARQTVGRTLKRK